MLLKLRSHRDLQLTSLFPEVGVFMPLKSYTKRVWNWGIWETSPSHWGVLSSVRRNEIKQIQHQPSLLLRKGTTFKYSSHLRRQWVKLFGSNIEWWPLSMVGGLRNIAENVLKQAFKKIWSLLAHSYCLTFVLSDLLFCLEHHLLLYTYFNIQVLFLRSNSLILKLKHKSAN